MMNDYFLFIFTFFLLCSVKGFVRSTSNCRPRGLDLVFALDSSYLNNGGSESFLNSKEFIKKIVQLLPLGIGPEQTQVGLYQFGRNEYLSFPPGALPSKEDIISIIDTGVFFHNSSACNIADAIEYANRTFWWQQSRSFAYKVVAFVTKGNSNQSVDSISASQKMLQKQGIELYAFAPGTADINFQNLIAITGGQSRVFKNFNDVKNIFSLTGCETACRQLGADLVFAIDGSLNTQERNFVDTVHFVISFVKAINFGNGEQDSRVGVFQFSESPTEILSLNNSMLAGEVVTFLNLTKYENGSESDIVEAMQFGSAIFRNNSRSNGQKALIFLTTGVTQETNEQITNARENIQKDGILPFAIGFSFQGFERLEPIAGDTSRIYPLLDDFPHKNGLPDAERLTGEDCSKICKARGVDLVFALDTSKNTTEEYFNLAKKFVLETVDNLTIGSGSEATQIGIFSFSALQNKLLLLQDGKSKFLIKYTIDGGVYYQPGATDYFAPAIDFARIEMFQSATGARPNAPKVLVFLSKGVRSAYEDISSIRMANSRANNESITVFSLGFGSEDTNLETLQAIAGDKSRVYEDLAMLDDATKLTGEICY